MQIKEHPSWETSIKIKKLLICLHSRLHSSTLIYIRLVTRLHSSTFVYTRVHSSSVSSTLV